MAYIEYPCNVPFCTNTRDYKHPICSIHRWEMYKFKVKKYKELLPFWSTKRCDIHGYLRPSQSYFHPTNKNYLCRKCKDSKKALHNPIQKKEYYKKHALRMKDRDLKKNYGINLDQYNSMIITQNNCCDICKVKSKKLLHVDHNHKTKKVRALLCFKCNIGIGYFNDSIKKLQEAINYLLRHQDEGEEASN